MLLTTKPSVLSQPSLAAIAAAITAASSSSCTGAAKAGSPAGKTAGAGCAVFSVPGAFFFFQENFFSSAGMNLKQLMQPIMMIRTANTVPIPITVLSAALVIRSPKEYSTSAKIPVR